MALTRGVGYTAPTRGTRQALVRRIWSRWPATTARSARFALYSGIMYWQVLGHRATRHRAVGGQSRHAGGVPHAHARPPTLFRDHVPDAHWHHLVQQAIARSATRSSPCSNTPNRWPCSAAAMATSTSDSTHVTGSPAWWPPIPQPGSWLRRAVEVCRPAGRVVAGHGQIGQGGV